MGPPHLREYDLEDRLIEFAGQVCRLIEKLPSDRVGNHVAGQLLRAGTAPAPNYGEAQGAESRRDFIHKLRLCLKELRETQVWLKFVRHLEIIPGPDLEPALAESDQLIAIFVAGIATAPSNSADGGGVRGVRVLKPGRA